MKEGVQVSVYEFNTMADQVKRVKNTSPTDRLSLHHSGCQKDFWLLDEGLGEPRFRFCDTNGQLSLVAVSACCRMTWFCCREANRVANAMGNSDSEFRLSGEDLIREGSSDRP